MNKQMKVHVYKVMPELKTPDLTVVLNFIGGLTLDKRLRSLGKELQEIRVERIHKPTSANPYWLMDFTHLRFDHGPGKVNRSTPIEGFDLDSDEGFGEETAALYHPKSGYIFIQYNHYGVRASSIGSYLSEIRVAQGDSYSLIPKIDDQSAARLAKTKIIKKLNFKIAPVNMNSSAKSAGVSLGNILDMSNELNAETIEVIVSSGRSANSNLLYTKARAIIEKLNALLDSDDVLGGNVDVPRALQKFEIHGRKEIDAPTEAIDMLTPKLEYLIDGLVMGEDKRYTYESRWNALRRVYSGCDFL